MSETLEIQRFPLWDKLKAKQTPVSFEIELTARCNNDCRHCYIGLPAGDIEAREKEMTPPEIERIAAQAVGMGAIWCLITGGEPLLRPDFEDIYLRLKRLGLLVSVFTNATLITDEHIRLFRRYPPRDIEVTVYGVTRETYERISRRPGSFEAFMSGLDRLLSNGIRVRLKAMAMRSNLAEFPAIAQFCKARTKDFYRFDPQLHLRFDRDAKRNEVIRAERLSPAEIVALEKVDEKRTLALRKNCDLLIMDTASHYGCDHLFHCGAGQGSFTIGPDGRFRLCSSLWEEGATYDLREGTLEEACFRFTPAVRDRRSRRASFLETCRKCPIVNLCLWCPAHAHLETGELDGETPYFCEVAHARAENIRNP